MHDPERHVGYLRQALAQDKAPIGLFLGAGCPVAISVRVGTSAWPLIPAIAGMTQRVGVALRDSPHAAAFERMVENLGDDGLADANVEDWLSHIRGLRIVAGSGTVRGLASDDLDALDVAIGDAIAKLVDVELPSTDTPYHQFAAWAGSIPRAHPIQVFTPNYDLLVEEALEALRIPYFDGFVGSRQSFFDLTAMEDDALPTRWLRLWKLHGSVNWRVTSNGVVVRGGTSTAGEHRLIHPSHLKYDESRRMPYLAMIDRLRTFLRSQGAVLVVCGYSFGDQHLNEVILQGLEGNPTAVAFGLMRGEMAGKRNAETLAGRRSNLSVLAKDAAVIGTITDAWGRSSSLDLPPNTTAVTWTAAPAGASVGAHSATVALGDFAVFGRFLAELIGHEPVPGLAGATR